MFTADPRRLRSHGIASRNRAHPHRCMLKSRRPGGASGDFSPRERLASTDEVVSDPHPRAGPRCSRRHRDRSSRRQVQPTFDSRSSRWLKRRPRRPAKPEHFSCRRSLPQPHRAAAAAEAARQRSPTGSRTGTVITRASETVSSPAGQAGDDDVERRRSQLPTPSAPAAVALSGSCGITAEQARGRAAAERSRSSPAKHADDAARRVAGHAPYASFNRKDQAPRKLGPFF